MSKNNIWYLAGPFHQYQEDVKALAKENGLTIIDANAAESRKGAAKDVPEVTIRPELQAVVIVGAGGLSTDVSDALAAELASIGVIVELFAEQRLERPAGELGETSVRLLEVLEAVNAGVAGLQRERDGLAGDVDRLKQEGDELRQQIDALKAAAIDPEVEAMKAKLDAAGVTYRANASKENLQKLVDDLSKA